MLNEVRRPRRTPTHGAQESGLDRDELRICELQPFDPSLKKYFRQVNPSDPGYGLCDTCNSINFLDIFCVDPNKSGSQGERYFATHASVDFLSDKETFRSADCPLCRVLRNCADNHRLEVRDFRGLYFFDQQSSLYTRLSPERNQLSLCFRGGTFSDRISVLAPTNWKHRRPSLLPGLTPRAEYLDSGSVLYPLFSKEIQHCTGIVDQKDSRPLKRDIAPGDMKVIDCRTCKVVDYDHMSDYLTLSYVWGQQLERRASVDLLYDAVIVNAPRVIQDAMTVTLSLGKFFFWVDRYCIDQFDPAKKILQINNMSIIFRHSWVTIVSVEDTAEAPLPGVSTARETLGLIQTSYCDLLCPSLPPESHVKSSVWNTRAWTMQEAILSGRLLFFAPSEAYLICNHGVTFESLDGQGHNAGPRFFGHSPTSYFRPRRDIFRYETIPKAINEYCSRALTYESDSLNAFRGYLQNSGLYSYWGVMALAEYQEPHWWRCEKPARPHHLDNGFCLGLLWHSPIGNITGAQKTPRSTESMVCSMFPSWSWTSCRSGTKLISAFTLGDVPTIHVASSLLNTTEGEVLPISTIVSRLVLSSSGRLGRIIPESQKWLFVRGRVLYLTPMNDKAPLHELWGVTIGSHNITPNTTYLPDQRTCCSRHVELGRVGGLDAAILIFVTPHWPDCNKEGLLTTYWIALQHEKDPNNVFGDAGYWHRVGLIIVTFAFDWPYQQDGSRLYSEEKKSCRARVEATILKDISDEKHIQTLRLG